MTYEKMLKNVDLTSFENKVAANPFCKSLFQEETPLTIRKFWSNMHKISSCGAEILFRMEKSVLSITDHWQGECNRCGLRSQVLPTVIQMTAPPHRQWGCTTTYPGETDTVAGTLNFQCNLHELVGGIWNCGWEWFLLLLLKKKHCRFKRQKETGAHNANDALKQCIYFHKLG